MGAAAMDLMHAETRCTARRKSGEPCRNYAMLGSNVCRMHGGGAPQVRRAAQVRLANAAEELVQRLLGLARDGDVPAAVQLAAIRDALDRAGLGATQSLDVTVGARPDWEQRVASVVIAADLPALPAADVIDAEVVEEPAPPRLRPRPRRAR